MRSGSTIRVDPGDLRPAELAEVGAAVTVIGSSNTHLSGLKWLKSPNYRFTTQFFGLFGWLCFAHL